MAVIRRSSPLPTPRSFEEVRARFSQPLSPPTAGEGLPAFLRAALATRALPTAPIGEGEGPPPLLPPDMPFTSLPISEEHIPTDLNIAEQAAATIAGMALDPVAQAVFAAGGPALGAAGRAAAGLVAPRFAAPVAGAVAGGLGLGTYDVLGGIAEAQPPAEILGRGVRGAATGALAGGGGALAAPFGTLPRLAAETAAFGTAAPLFEGRAPTPEDYAVAAGMVGGMAGLRGARRLPEMVERATPQARRLLAEESGALRFDKPLPPEELQYTPKEQEAIDKFEKDLERAIVRGTAPTVLKSAITKWLTDKFPDAKIVYRPASSNLWESANKYGTGRASSEQINLEVQRFLQSGAWNRAEAKAMVAGRKDWQGLTPGGRAARLRQGAAGMEPISSKLSKVVDSRRPLTPKWDVTKEENGNPIEWRTNAGGGASVNTEAIPSGGNRYVVQLGDQRHVEFTPGQAVAWANGELERQARAQPAESAARLRQQEKTRAERERLVEQGQQEMGVGEVGARLVKEQPDVYVLYDKGQPVGNIRLERQGRDKSGATLRWMDTEGQRREIGFVGATEESIQRLRPEDYIAKMREAEAPLPEAAPAAPTVREPWQMTQGEFAKLGERFFGTRPMEELEQIGRIVEADYRAMERQQYDDYVARGYKGFRPGLRFDIYTLENEHRAYVKLALTEGKPVPPEVMADYPDLARPEAATTPPIEPTAPTVPPRVAPAAREPWQMTAAEFNNVERSRAYGSEGEAWFGASNEAMQAAQHWTDETRRLLGNRTGQEILALGDKYGRNAEHHEVVSAALAAGKPVPPEVLADYPDLARAVPIAPVAGVRAPEVAPAARAVYIAPADIPARAREMTPAELTSRVSYAETEARRWQESVANIEAQGRDSGEARMMVEAWTDQARLLRQAQFAAPEAEVGPVQAAQGAVPPRQPPPTGGGIPPTGAEPPPIRPAEGVPPIGPTEPPGGEPQPQQPAPTLGPNILGLRDITPGLTRMQTWLNLARQTVGKPFGAIEDDPIATAAMSERARVQEPIRSLASQLSVARDADLRRVFTFDKQGRIPDLAGVVPEVPGAPTLADVAARLPLYEARLTPEQGATLGRLREALAPYRELLGRVGVEVGSRPDVVEGGFYVPRGRADIEGADDPVKVGVGIRGTRKGFEKPTVFDSQAEGIEKGFAYSPLRDTLQAYARDAGVRATDAHVANYFKTVIDAEGNVIAETAADRVNPVLRDKVNGLRARIAGRTETLQNQGVRGTAQTAEAKRRGQDVTRMGKRVGTAQWIATEVGRAYKEGTLAGNTEAGLAETRKALQVLQQEARYTGKRLTQADVRAGRTTSRYQETADAIKSFQEELDGLSAEWELSKRKAAQTPREQGVIGLPSLQGYSFPDAVANAANKVLQTEGPPHGFGSQAVRVIAAYNRMYRGFTSTLDNSAMGIQLLLGGHTDPKAYARAARVNLLAWGRGGDEMFGRYINDYDQTATRDGAPTVEEWARAGTHIGGAASEFELRGPMERVPGVRQANRAFGYAGDSMRLEWNRDEFGLRQRETGLSKEQLIANGELERISAATNGATGWSGKRFAGDIGELFQYAPRFFQSRLETVARAAMSAQGLVGKNVPLEQRIARRSLLRLIGQGTLLTVALNALANQDTDFRPFVNGKWNSNFMRVRAFGRDWSLFGTWDSLIGAIARTATGDPAGAVRGLASGAVSGAWDLIGNKDWDGNPTRDDPVQFGRWLLQSFTPFATQEIPAIAGLVAKGDIPAAAATLVGETTGAKSTPVTNYELRSAARDKAAMAQFGKKWDDLGPTQQNQLATRSELQQAETAYKAGRTGVPDITEMLRQQREVGDAVEAKLPKNVQTEMNRLGVNVSVERSISQGTSKLPTYYLSDQLFARYQERIAYHLGGLAATTMASATWRSANDAANEQQLSKIMAEAKRRARIDVLKEAGGGATSQTTVPAPTATPSARPSFQQVRERFSQPLLPAPVMP